MGSGKSYKSYKTGRCFETHPPYEVAPGIKIYGGYCGNPIVTNADVYIGFDGCMKIDTPFPWNDTKETAVQVFFRITDRQPPSNLTEFKKMIAWTAEQLKAGKLIHAGCIGGHGRTGLFLAALHKHMTGDEDAITHVRTNYCKKAVESTSQVNWLHDHFGIKKVEGSKASHYSGSGYSKNSLGLVGGSKGGSYSNMTSTGLPQNPEVSIWAGISS